MDLDADGGRREFGLRGLNAFSWREAAVARFCTPRSWIDHRSPVVLSGPNRRQFVNARDGEGALADGKADHGQAEAEKLFNKV
jgi:hypothetical protein